MSDTPRTEAAKFSGIHAHPSEHYVDADFARELERELERELAEAKAENARLRESLKSVRELCTTDHESKDRFIARVLLCLPNA